MTYAIKILQLEQSSLSIKMEALAHEIDNPNKDVAAQAAMEFLALKPKLEEVTKALNDLLDIVSKETVERVAQRNKN